jgi:putative mRNA 3-end processing factor
MNAYIEVLGSGREVGRAAIAIWSGKGRALLLDYGVNFDEEDRPLFPGHIRPKDVEALVLTHSHLDHVGAAPMLYVSIKPRLIGTPLTLEVSRLLLFDMIKLNGPFLPFDEQVVDMMLDSAETVGYDEEVKAGDFTLKLLYNGHIPGSAAVLVEVNGNRVLYTSDMNTIETKLMGPARFEGVKADTVIIESTYSTYTHPDRRLTEERFYKSVREVVEAGGTVLVPAFSVSRSQEIMAILAERDFEYPVWIDGMSRQVADLYALHPEYLHKPGLLRKALGEQNIVRGWGDRRRALKKPGVIISSAGTLKGGPSLYYLRRLGSDPKNAVFLVSFQPPGTPGRRLVEEGIYGDGGEPLKARLEWFDFSSHTDRRGILSALHSIKGLERVILVHGEYEGQASLAKEIEEKLGVEVYIPENGERIPLAN